MHFASICRSKHKVIEIDDTNSNAESDDADINELYIDHGRIKCHYKKQ